MPEVIHAAILQLTPEQQPVAVWVTETYAGDKMTIEIIKSDDYTLWSYIVLIPRPLAYALTDWKGFLVVIAQEIIPKIESM